MIRKAFTMRLKPGALAEYKRHHDSIWPELVAQIEREPAPPPATMPKPVVQPVVTPPAEPPRQRTIVVHVTPKEPEQP